jgi:hypothetical protein
MSANDGAAIAPTIQEILGDEDLAMLFREYLHQLQCAENLSFYIEAEDYKRIPGEADRCERAERIWSKYLHSDASTPLNVDSKVRQRIQQLIPNAPMDLFDEASEFAFSLLSFDCYRKFVGSETYQKWLSTSDFSLHRPHHASVPSYIHYLSANRQLY